MLPLRLRAIRPYLASFIHPRFLRPPIWEITRWLIQPGKKSRAKKYINELEDGGDYIKIKFVGHEKFFYYPIHCSWVDLCQTIDECFTPKNWHHFISKETTIDENDTVIDCGGGAAEGLFSFIAARTAKKVYAIEPVPAWHKSLIKTFTNNKNVEVLKIGLGHKKMIIKMIDHEIYSKISSDGTLKIPIETIDSIFYDRGIPVTLIKADVEGFEFPLILGAENTIFSNRPKIAITVYHDTNNFAEIRDFLKNIHNNYSFKIRGIAENGNPVLLQAF